MVIVMAAAVPRSCNGLVVHSCRNVAMLELNTLRGKWHCVERELE